MRNNLKHEREKRGLNQRQLAELSHTPQSLISALERNKITSWPKVRDRLSTALSLPVSRLFPQGGDGVGD